MNWILLLQRIAIGALLTGCVAGLAYICMIVWDWWIEPRADRIMALVGIVGTICIVIVFFAMVGAIFIKGDLFP